MFFPIAQNLLQTAFLVMIVLVATIVIANTNRIFDSGPLVAVIVALAISAASMQFWAAVLEQRLMLPPSDQYLSFFWGDLIFLPFIALTIALKLQDLPEGSYWWRGTAWTLVSLGLALAFAAAFRWHDMNAYPASQYGSPTKLWHDWFVYVTFSFILLSNVPALFVGRWRPELTLTAIACITVWLALGIYDGSHKKPRAHVNYDWTHLRQINSRS